MYKIPLTNSPNQTFSTSIPVNGENRYFVIELNYIYSCGYWSMTLTDSTTEQILVSNIPLLFSEFDFIDIFRQLGYKEIGEVYIVPVKGVKGSMPNYENLGQDYVMLWGDNTYV